MRRDQIAGAGGGRAGAGVWMAVCVLLVFWAGCDRGGDGGEADGPTARQAPGESTAESRHDTGAEDERSNEAEDDSERPSREEMIAEMRASPRTSRGDAGRDGGSARESCSFFPDSCEADGEACFSTADGRHRCSSVNPNKSPGDSCRAADDCDEGQQCVGGRPGTCRRICRPGAGRANGCGRGARCVRVYDTNDRRYPWGVCHEIDDSCTMWPNDDCRIGENCYRTPVGRRCQRYTDTAEVGDRCPDGPTDCNFGQVCVRTDSAGRRCRDRCDAEHACKVGRCRPLSDQHGGFCDGGANQEGPPRRRRETGDDGDELRGWGP